MFMDTNMLFSLRPRYMEIKVKVARKSQGFVSAKVIFIISLSTKRYTERFFGPYLKSFADIKLPLSCTVAFVAWRTPTFVTRNPSIVAWWRAFFYDFCPRNFFNGIFKKENIFEYRIQSVSSLTTKWVQP